MFEFGIIDAHCHLFTSDNQENISDVYRYLHKAKSNNITGFISTALTKEELVLHEQNKFQEIQFIAGIHPHYKNTSINDIYFIDEAARNKSIIGLGEIGLDGRFENISKQKKILLAQLEIARDFDLPIIFHIVKEYYNFLSLIKKTFPKTRGYIHNFNGSLEIFQEFRQLNLGFSIHKNLLKRKRNIQIINAIINNCLFFFETDAIIQNNKNFNLHQNELVSLINDIANLIGVPFEQLLYLQYKNINQIFEHQL